MKFFLAAEELAEPVESDFSKTRGGPTPVHWSRRSRGGHSRSKLLVGNLFVALEIVGLEISERCAYARAARIIRASPPPPA